MGNCMKKTNSSKVANINLPTINVQDLNTININVSQKRKSLIEDEKKKLKFQQNMIVIETSRATKQNKQINQYKQIRTLGQGAYGKVKLFETEILGRTIQYAIKICKKSILKKIKTMYKDKNGKLKYENALDDVKQEIQIMKQINHFNIVRIHEVIDDEETDKIYIVMEYCQFGPLLEWNDKENKFSFTNSIFENISEDQLREILRGVLLGINYSVFYCNLIVHSQNIAHRDIKPQNIFFDQYGHPKIGDQIFLFKSCDFGISLKDEGNKISNRGTYLFMAPELHKKNASECDLFKADIWSLGITFYTYAYLKLPFHGNCLQDVIDCIETQGIHYPEKSNLSSKFTDFLSKLLQKDPINRWTLQQLATHEWINDQGWTNLLDEFKEDQQILLMASTLPALNIQKITLMVQLLYKNKKKIVKKIKNYKKVKLDQINGEQIEFQLDESEKQILLKSQEIDQTENAKNFLQVQKPDNDFKQSKDSLMSLFDPNDENQEIIVEKKMKKSQYQKQSRSMYRQQSTFIDILKKSQGVQ